MKVKFGDLDIDVHRVGDQPNWQDFLLDVKAPGLGPFTFHAVYQSGRSDYEAVEQLIFTLKDIWADPSAYIARRMDAAALSQTMSEEEQRREVASAEADAKRVTGIVGLLDPFIPAADEDLWRKRGLPREEPIERKGPREWLPGKKRLPE